MRTRKMVLVLAVIGIFLLTAVPAVAAPAKTPPVTLGPKTLTGDGTPPTAYEFFLQPGSGWKGDIGGIGAGPTYSLVIEGIDVTGVTGPAGRYVYFNLQDAEEGSSFKHLGINVHLQAVGSGGPALLQCYQEWTNEGISSHGFNAGELTESFFDLRFDFTKASAGVGWTVTPYYRLSGGSWTVFYDGSFTGTVAFDFLGGKLIVTFDGGADGTVSFDNYYLVGPPSNVYVDDDWVGLPDGSPVQFPGQTEYRTIGVDAFDTVQEGISAVTSGGNVYVAAGTYVEVGQIVISKNLSITGADKATTIIKPAQDTGSSDDARGWWLPQTGYTFNLSKVTLDGQGRNIYQAIRSYAAGTIDDCILQNVKYSKYVGIGVVLYGNMTVSNCTFTNMERIGVIAFDTSCTSSVITGSTYTGKGDGDWLDYAVEVGGGAQATISNNTFSGCTGVASSDGSTSAGILVTTYYGAGTQATITGNVLTGNTTGIAVGYDGSDTSAVVAHGNSIYGNTSYGITTTAPAVDAEDNWWGSANGPEHASNTFNVGAQGNAVEDGIDFVPWLDAAPPGGVSFAPVTTDTPVGKHSSIQAGVDYATGGTVSAVAGTYTEDNILVDKGLTLQGAGSATTIIDAQSSTNTGNVVSINLTSGNVTVDGFQIRSGQDMFGVSHKSSSAASTITLSNNKLVGYGAGAINEHDFCVIGGYGSVARVVLTANEISNCNDNCILMERQLGETEITGNSITVGPSGMPAIFYMSYKTGGDNNDVVTKQHIHDNTIDANGGSGIVFASAVGLAGYNEQTNGKFTNVEIADNTISNVGDYGKGIQLEMDGDDGGFEDVRIAGNTISAQNPGSGTSRGIRLLGTCVDTVITENAISGTYRGVYLSGTWGQPIYPVGTQIFGNSITGGTYRVDHVDPASTADASGNWWGTFDSAAIPGLMNGSVDYTPWLASGTDTSGDPGFQGDFSTLWVDDDSPQTGSTGLIQEGVDLVSASTVNVAAGTYPETVTIAKAVNLLGAQAGNAVSGRTAGSAAESIIDARGLSKGVLIKHSNVTLNGFDIWGDGATYAGVHVYATVGAGSLTTIDVLNNFVHGMALPNPSSTYYVTSYGIWSLGDAVGGVRNTITDLAVQGNEVYDLGGVASGSDVSAGAGVWLYSIQGGGGGGGALISGNHFHDINDGYNSPVPEPGAGVAVIDDEDPVPDGGASVTGNQYDNTFGGVVVYSSNCDVDELGSNFSGVTLLVLNTGNLATVNEPHLEPYAKTDKPTGSPSSTAYFAKIQDAVDYSDAGATVTVSAGTFEEQVVIAKDLTLVGQGSSSIVRAPTTVPVCFVTSKDNRPIVCIKDSATATVDSFLIDGAGRGNSNVRFEGVAFRNAGGTVQNCTIQDVRDTPFSGAQHGVAVYVYNDDTTTRTIHVLDNTITGFQKNAMALNAGDTTPLVVDVQRNVVTGAGATTVTAQNGIQVWADLGSGTVAYNTISGIAYDNTASATKWAATSILNDYADLDILWNDISGAHLAVYNIEGAGSINDNDLSIEKVGVYAYGVCATDPPQAVPSPFGADDMEKASQLSVPDVHMASTLSVDMSRNTVTFSGTDNTSTYGIEADAGYGPDDIAVTANDNTVTGFELGIAFYACEEDCDTGVFTSLTAHGNCMSGNSYGMWTNVPSPVTDGTLNWWGDGTGPYHPTLNAGGLGDAVSDYIDFDPWISDGCGGTATTGHWKNLRTGAYDDLAGSLAAAISGDTIQGVCSGSTPIPGGGTASIGNVTIDLNGCVVGPGSPFLTVDSENVTVLGPGTLDGWDGSANSTDPAIRVLGGADNFILQGVEILRWEDGISLEGSVISFKVGENFIHDNTDTALDVQSGADLGGVVTIEGNLFKDNGGPGVRHSGVGTLPAEYNSWGDLDGPTGPLGDGVGAAVEYIPWTFAELFLDMEPDTEAVVHHVLETTAFEVKLKADAAKLYGLSFVFSYDAAKLTLDSTTFSAPWAGRCSALPGLPAGTIGYFCNLQAGTSPDPEWDADGGTIATFGFTAFSGTPGNGPWTAMFDISHLETDTSASAKGGQKVFVNNAGFNDATIMPERDITDGDDGQIIIERGANYTGFVNLQGRLSDSLAVCRVWNQAAKAGAIELANGTSASSGAYTTAYIPPHWLVINNTYYLTIDRWLFLSTTPAAATDFQHSRILDAYPTTTLPQVELLGGDANNDEQILIDDLSCIGGDYLGSGVKCGTDGWSDVNEDGLVNIQDLSLAGGNFYKTYSPWTVP